jgi:hypothetical protein
MYAPPRQLHQHWQGIKYQFRRTDSCALQLGRGVDAAHPDGFGDAQAMTVDYQH